MIDEIKIYDIKPLIHIPDYSLYIFYGIIILGIITTLIIIYFIYNYVQNKKINTKKLYYEQLKSLNLNNTKQSAYDITKYGTLLVTQSNQEIFNKLIYILEDYKYKKHINNFDKNTKELITSFINKIEI